MNTNEVEAQILAFLHNECGADEGIARDDVLFSSGVLDSMDVVSLLAFLEETLGVRIPPLEVAFDKIDSVALIAALVERYKNV